jgi:tetratricopeptide (TPR) repeat protein
MRFWVLIFSLILWVGATQAKSPLKLFEQLDHCIFENPDSAQILFTELGKSYASLSSKQKGRFCSNKGIFYAMQGDFKQAIRNLNLAYKFTEPNSIQRSNTLKNLANVYKSNANYSKALSLLNRSLFICKNNQNKEEELSVLGEIAAIQYYQFNWAQAIKTNKKVIAGLQKIKDFRLLAIQEQRLANIYFSLERYDDAIAVYRHSMQYYDKHSSEKLNAAYIRIGLGDAYFAQEHFV